MGTGVVAAMIVSVYNCNFAQPFESVAVTVKVKVPGVVGVPEITPPLVSGNKPVGRAPVVTLKV